MPKKRKVADLTVDEFEQIIRKVIWEVLSNSCTVDEKGYLVFCDEQSYARYLALTKKKPSKVKAYWVEHGLRFRYSDDEVTPELARELDDAKREIEAGNLIPYEQVRKELGI